MCLSFFSRFYIVAPWLLYHSLQALDKGRSSMVIQDHYGNEQHAVAWIVMCTSAMSGWLDIIELDLFMHHKNSMRDHRQFRKADLSFLDLASFLHSLRQATARRPGFSSPFPWQASCSVGGLTRPPWAHWGTFHRPVVAWVNIWKIHGQVWPGRVFDMFSIDCYNILEISASFISHHLPLPVTELPEFDHIIPGGKLGKGSCS